MSLYQYAGLSPAQKAERLALLRFDAKLPNEPGLSEMKPEAQLAWVRGYNEEHARPHPLLPRQLLADKATYTIDERRDSKAKRLQVMEAQAQRLAARDAELVSEVEAQAACMSMGGVEFSADKPVDVESAVFVDAKGAPLSTQERGAVLAKVARLAELGILVLVDGPGVKTKSKKGKKPEGEESAPA